MNMNIPAPVGRAIDVLNSCGFEGYLVGGCVRDSLLGSAPYDFDITTNALPEQIIECFNGYRVIDTGLKHGTLTLVIDHTHVEITTYRIDGEYIDSRRPQSVIFTSSLKDDLSRRDFTINAMAYAPNGEVIDFFGGRQDLKNRLVRCVGNPDKRFGEDALRMLRALRFAAVLGFEIEERTSQSIINNRMLLKNISVERIAIELNKLIVGQKAGDILDKYRDAFAVFIPEIEPMFDFDQKNYHHNLDVWQHTLKSVASAPQDAVLRLTMLFHDIGKPQCFSIDAKGVGHFYGHNKTSAQVCSAIMRRLKYDNTTHDTIKTLVSCHDITINADEKSVRRTLNRLGETNMRRLLNIKRADSTAQNPQFTDERLAYISRLESILDNVLQARQCFSLKDLAVDGHDMMELGIYGSQIGNMLTLLLDMVIDGTIENTRDVLLAKSRELGL